MRILHIGKFYPPFPGGMENFLGDLMDSSAGAGLSAKALVHAAPGGGTGTSGFQASRVHAVPCHGSILYAPISPLFPFYLNRLIHAFHPDLLHLHLPNTSAFWVTAVPAARSIPWVVHWHSDVVPSLIDRRMATAYKLYRPFEHHLLSRSRAVVATSPPYLETSRALAPFREKCRVIPLGLAPERLKPAGPRAKSWAEKIWGSSPTRVLAIGRLTYYKGHGTLIRAAAGVPGLKVVIAGEGEQKPYLAELIARLGAGEKALLSGYLEEEKLQALLATCDCLCLPSVERTEAFGLVLLEAMAHGKAIVVTGVPGSGMGWVVEPGKTGLIVPPGNADALGEALAHLSAHPEKRNRMGRAAKEKFNDSFRIGRVTRRMGELYREIVAGTFPPS